MPCTVSKDKWDTKEDTGKSRKHVLTYCGMSHLSGSSNVEQKKSSLYPLPLLSYTCLKASVRQPVSTKFHQVIKNCSNPLEEFQVILKALFSLVIPNQYCQSAMKVSEAGLVRKAPNFHDLALIIQLLYKVTLMIGQWKFTMHINTSNLDLGYIKYKLPLISDLVCIKVKCCTYYVLQTHIFTYASLKCVTSCNLIIIYTMNGLIIIYGTYYSLTIIYVASNPSLNRI